MADLHDKLGRMVVDLRERGVGGLTSAPPLYRLLWRIGVRARPLLFQPFWVVALVTGGFAAVSWSLLMWVLVSPADRLGRLLLFAVAVGLMVGLPTASSCRTRARELRLPAWEHYLPRAR